MRFKRIEKKIPKAQRIFCEKFITYHMCSTVVQSTYKDLALYFLHHFLFVFLFAPKVRDYFNFVVVVVACTSIIINCLQICTIFVRKIVNNFNVPKKLFILLIILYSQKEKKHI